MMIEVRSIHRTNDEMTDHQVKPGRYRHFKGHDYIVLGVALHSETQEVMIVYQQDYGDRRMWVRPKAMFLETVEYQGRQVPRFQYLDD